LEGGIWNNYKKQLDTTYKQKITGAAEQLKEKYIGYLMLQHLQ